MQKKQLDEQITASEIIEIMIGNKVIERNEKGEIQMGGDMPDVVGMHDSIGEITRADERRMLASGILSRDNGELKVNEAALHALTVLAKSFGKDLPEIGSAEAVMEHADDASTANVQTGTAEPPRSS